ncbi:Palmitoyl-protein thioesterase 1 [Kickxella alabastrina]|uniref:Palmitoyl-protein thioesterase 1 n=1 Tax=Kickxella alabastrina TaxID=61397 RepID=A0ACC1IQ66_9FUNG|nr:Palmitoyl-protein thioesterase 1 [Kickxella alabastrina]
MDIAKTASALKQRGDTAFRQGKYALATEFYTQAIGADHDVSPTLYTNCAQAELKQHKYREAIVSCTNALALDTRNVKALGRRGTAYARLGEHLKAEHDLQVALLVEPTNKTLARELETVKKVVKPGMEQPRNSLVFERAWREYGAHPELLYEYLRHISAEELPMLFRTSLESRHIAQIATAAEYAQSERNDAKFGATLLGALPRVERFALAVLFLGEGDRHLVQKIIKSSECEHVLAAQYE